MVVGQRGGAFQAGDSFLSPQFHPARRKPPQSPEHSEVAGPVHQRGRAFRVHAASRRAVVPQGAAFHSRLRARPGLRRGGRRSAIVVACVSLAGTRFGFLPAPRLRRHHVDAVVADGGVAAFRFVVDVGLADFPGVGAGGELRPACSRVVAVPSLRSRRLRVFLQIHLRHHVAVGVLDFQASPVVHPKEERAGAVKFFSVRSFRDGERAVRAVAVRRRARRPHGSFLMDPDRFKRQRIGLRLAG